MKNALFRKSRHRCGSVRSRGENRARDGTMSAAHSVTQGPAGTGTSAPTSTPVRDSAAAQPQAARRQLVPIPTTIRLYHAMTTAPMASPMASCASLGGTRLGRLGGVSPQAHMREAKPQASRLLSAAPQTAQYFVTGIDLTHYPTAPTTAPMISTPVSCAHCGIGESGRARG